MFKYPNTDHHPITLAIEKEDDLNHIPFRFRPLWIERGGFFDTVVQAWTQYVVGSPTYVWEQKLKNTNSALKIWIKNPHITPASSRHLKVIELSEFQFEMEEREITKS